MKRLHLPHFLLAAFLFLEVGCTPAETKMEAATTPTVSNPTADSTTSGLPTATARPIAPEHKAFLNHFPELPLPYTITLTGDAFDKADEKNAIRPAATLLENLLGFELGENGYQNSFISITPVGKITKPGATVLLYVVNWDGECPVLSTTTTPTGGGSRVLDIQTISCGPCAIITGPIVITNNSITKKLLRSDDCGNEGNPTKQTSSAEYALTNTGPELTKETPWQKVK